MKKLLVLFLFIAGNIFAALGWYSDYVIIGGTYYWIGSNPSFGTQFDSHSFGTVSTLEITDADMKYWSDTQDRTGGAFNWMIKSSDGNTVIVAATEVIWSQSALGGNDYQGTWTGTIDLLAGLSPNTTYQLHVWVKSWGSNQGDNYLNNSGANYIATFQTDGSVPVELTSFSAYVNDKSIYLNWQTATEVNNYGFEIERSLQSAASSWQNIGFIQGSGNSNSTKQYSFIDENPSAGRLLYRLKQIDVDGSFSYSNDIEVTFDPSVSVFNLLQNYPNPFNPVTVISYQLSVISPVQLKVYDVLGSEVITLVNEAKEPGLYTVEFNGSQLSSGIYFYKIQTPEFSQVKKMILTK